MSLLHETPEQVKVHGWTIQTSLAGKGQIVASEESAEGKYIIMVNNEKVVDISFYHDDLLRIESKEGYLVQMIVSEKFISVIEKP